MARPTESEGPAFAPDPIAAAIEREYVSLLLGLVDEPEVSVDCEQSERPHASNTLGFMNDDAAINSARSVGS